MSLCFHIILYYTYQHTHDIQNYDFKKINYHKKSKLNWSLRFVSLIQNEKKYVLFFTFFLFLLKPTFDYCHR